LKAISQKWRKIQGKLVLITNKKSHISFHLVPKSVTLNDLNGVVAVILRYFSDIGGTGVHCVKVAEDIPKLSATEMFCFAQIIAE